MNRWLYSLILSAVAAISWCSLASADARTAPALAGRDLSGQQQELTDYRGKWVFVDFWASWCGPCMKELPKVVQLHKDMSTNPDFVVLGVSLDDKNTRDALQSAVKKNGVNYPVICDVSWDSSLMQNWGVEAIPATFLIDPEGRVVARDVAPTQVRNYVSRDLLAPAKQPLKPPSNPLPAPAGNGKVSQVKCKARLLEDSPSTGARGTRDLEISVGYGSDSRNHQYQLFIKAVRTTGTQQVEANWRYDLRLLYDPRDKLNPYKAEISAAETGLATITSSGTRPMLPPEVSVVLDTVNRTYMIYVPVLPNTAKLNYAVAQVVN